MVFPWSSLGLGWRFAACFEIVIDRVSIGGCWNIGEAVQV